MGDKKDEPLGDDDERLEYLLKYLAVSRKVKSDKFQKMLSTEEYKEILVKFFDVSTEVLLVIQLTTAGVLIPSLDIQQGVRTKSSYFCKKQPVKVTTSNYKDILIAGDMAPRPVDELATLVEEAYVPILSNPKNHVGWPETVVEDVKKHIYDLRNLICELRGKMIGQTLLPMPLGADRIFDAEWNFQTTGVIDIPLKSNIEHIFIIWASQINEILKEESTEAFILQKFPHPRAEVEFWKQRQKNVEAIHRQLTDPRVKKMASYLDSTESPYAPCYKTIIRNVTDGVLEARDVSMHLKPVEPYFEQVENTADFNDLEPLLKPMIQGIALAWTNSKYYCTSTRFITLMREVTNMIINTISRCLDPGSLFRDDIEDTLKRLHHAFAVVDMFEETYHLFREKLDQFYRPQNEPRMWNFREKLIFERLYKFRTRLNDLAALFNIAAEYFKLERIELAGLKGKTLLAMILEIYEEFMKLYSSFNDVTYDILVPEESGFDADLHKFLTEAEEYDRRLGTVVDQVFSHCNNIEDMSKFVWILGSVGSRPIIRDQIWHNFEKLSDLMSDYFDNCKVIIGANYIGRHEIGITFDENGGVVTETGAISVEPSFPPVAGALCLLMMLKLRTQFPMECASLIRHPLIVESLSTKLKDKFNELETLIENAEQEIFQEWAQKVPTLYETHLSRPLLRITEEGELEVNFDTEISALLREVRYMIIMKRTDLPPEAMDLHKRTEFFFESTYNLNLMTNWYSQIRNNSLPVEYELLREEMVAAEELINFGQENYCWNSPEVMEYIEELVEIIRKLHARITWAQRNVTKLLEMINSWAMLPILDRKDLKDDNLLAINERAERFEKRDKEVSLVVEEIERVLEENFKLFFNLLPDSEYEEPDHEQAEEEAAPEEHVELADEEGAANRRKTEGIIEEAGVPGEGQALAEEAVEGEMVPAEPEVELTPEELERLAELEAARQVKWQPYLSYLDELIAKGLVQAAATSICYILDETDPEGMIMPLFEIQMCLEPPNIVFYPSVVIDNPSGFYAFYEGLMFEIMRMGTLIPRVNPELKKEREHYGADLAEDENIVFMLEETCNRVKLGLIQALQYSTVFEPYSWLWLDDRQEYLKLFLRFGRSLTEEEKEWVARDPDNLPETLKEKRPELEDFKNEIDRFMELYTKCEQIENEKILQRWLRIYVKPFKQTLLNTVCKWSNTLKTYLVESVNTDLKELSTFLDSAIHAFTQPVTEDDIEGLIITIYYLKTVRDRQFEIDDMFEPIKDVIDLLKLYDVKFEDETFNWLINLPETWANVKKMALQVKSAVGPMMAQQVELLKKRLSYFDFKQQKYLAEFQAHRVFNYDCVNVYEQLDGINKQITQYEDELKQLHETANIFEQPTQEYKHIKQARRELKLIKNLWDYVNIISTSLEEWNTTMWKKIDVEAMDSECKRLTRELRQLDKEARSWDLYTFIDGQVRNMMASLRAVSELQNPAIRERHWQQLMAETKVKFTMDDKTTLADLLKLELHKYEEEVKNTVDKAVKEMAMEKVLRELQNTWATLEFEKEVHERTKLQLLKITDEAIEILEDNQVQLQNMMSSKFVGYFLEEVIDWQTKLSNADAVIAAWFEVQRSWMNLESIFIGSEDIRSQLPEDSRRFEKIDRDFKELLREMTANLNIVKATNRPKLLEKLEELSHGLNLCEKALFDYLETKRLAYPRFYFISSADLLDILSNGNNPEMVCKHLSKLYDAIAKLKWKLEGGKASKMANTMIAKDGEEMPMYGTCDCTGKVEIWLNRLTDAMRRTVRYHFSQAVTTYEEKPREYWILDYEAQPALCGTQIWWTTEVNLAFARLEEGFENAMRDYQKKQISQLSVLIVLLCGELTDNDRQKIMTICTIDVHARDVVAKLISMKADSVSSFQWQSQLRHRWDDKLGDCFANICDACFMYTYEYLGNTPRLVITPLTDRCYITLTQSLHLVMGGGPAGPAGTGKTETTKDLGRALGQMVYVFNCSEQMDYKSCGNIYKGLAQTGAWGCFDEFNRISVEVLSVVAVQVKSVLDGVKNRRKKFLFFGEELNLVDTVGMFITMNPGYAGRTELPENLKTLFRPCAMVVPDFELICEIMLVAEGFQEARLLARKFITLYMLCRELLSKQDHYDWGLRAIKSVLVVAGKLKRGDRLRPEDQVLMRALRDFNTPKIVTDDVPVFMGLIGDLFPALDVPRKRDLDFEKMVKDAALDLKMQPEDGFILKVVQLEELLNVRHSVFIVGFAGTGKSQVWKTLFRTYFNQKRKPYYNDLDPKAVTNNELFGIINPATREWKDGLFSVLMRDQANMSGDGPKWIVFDGDIDPMWIESLNTVMDDNKVLTLASNERIALTKHMRLLFEISNLRTATPATVSRAGILYINPQDLGWNPFVSSWIETRESSERANLVILFDKYVPPLLEASKSKYKKITPLPEICHLAMLCNLLDCFLTKENVPSDCPKEWYELYFAFACIWAFGSATFQDQLYDWRNEFHKWWNNEFKTIKFPSGGTIFNYFIDSETKKLLPWDEKVIPFELDMEIPLQATLVSTGETACLRFFMDLLMKNKVPVMLVGGAGSGKSVIVAEKLGSLPDNYNVANVPLNFYTTSEMLQRVLEKYLEKKAGRNYGPPGTKLLVYFIDDMNMPEVDTYGTVQPHTLVRQSMEYNHWYDRTKLTLKDIFNTQFVSCMNPTAGSFTIDSRLQRHFAVFAVNFPRHEALVTIYSQILGQHLQNPTAKIGIIVQKMVHSLLDTILQLHQKVSASFLPTAVKFHYVFNLRDLSNLFQGMLFATGDTIPSPLFATKLLAHEAQRVYSDKLVDYEDKKLFRNILVDALRANIAEMDEKLVLTDPLVFCHFAEGIGEAKYMGIRDWPQLIKLLDDALINYNELVSAMNLVLFDDAMYHVCRINRILETDRGNALLVGVGGSGKQSLARLASFISSLEVFQVQLKKDYSLNDLRVDLAALYMKAGVKSMGITFLMSDAQVSQERFLVVVNDMLASGEISELFADDEIENIIGAVRNEVKEAGILDSKENCWKFFIARVRKNLKCVLCFSPVGATLRKRGRQFPALVNCTMINWFQDWPQKALESVSATFLEELEDLPTDFRHSVSLFMSFVHTSVNETSKTYLQNEKKYNYSTPKSFLEQIALYTKLLTAKTFDLTSMIERLENGLTKLLDCAIQADDLQVVLAVQEVELKKKNEVADKILQEVQLENTKAEVEKAIVTDEEVKIAEIKDKVSERQKRCDEDLAKAEPAVRQAEAALDTLNKNNLTELKSFGSPPEAVTKVAEAVLVLFAPKGKIPKDRSWKACKVMMGSVDQFLTQLRTYDKENIHPDIVKAIQPYINDKEFDPELIMSKSQAAAGLCSWVKNVMVFHYINETVKPLRAALAMANTELRTALEKLNSLRSKLSELEKMLDILGDKMNTALTAKQKCEDEANATATAIDLANRLVNGLGSEKIRWIETVSRLKDSGVTLPGDVLLITAFISYMGFFTRRYRVDLMDTHWLPFLDKLDRPIPRTADLDPLSLLTDDAQIALWNNEGLPADRMSTENATILTNSSRWPLIVDPQLQGLKWIKHKYGDDLIVLRLDQRNYLDSLENAISNGHVVLLENIMEAVDAVLDPVMGRVLVKKGRAVKIGDREVDYNPLFRLILQTKLANPHYKPEMQAQTTLINFTVTKDGLEEQLLGAVVKAERPDLEATKAELTTQQNTFKIRLKALEDDLLYRLSTAGPNVLSDVALVENLEITKKTAAEIEIKVAEAKITSVKIDTARELYRPVAARTSLLYFVLNDLYKINMLYQFSLKAFTVVFQNGIKFAEISDVQSQRVAYLIDSITYLVFMYTSRGLFESDKLIFLFQLTLQILIDMREIDYAELNFLLRFPYTPDLISPVDFLSNVSWGGIKFLCGMDEFRNLDRDIEGAAKRWKKLVESETPEKEPFPQEWKTKSALQRLCMMRCLRLDRMTYAIRCFAEEKLGVKYTQARSPPFEKSYEETSAITPVFFILSPGVDPLKDVEKLGKRLGFTFDLRNLHNVSLGQGQEPIAEHAMETAALEGHWVILQNIHLVRKWLAILEKKMEQVAENPNENFRLYMSAEPSSNPQESVIPQGILESAIKITNEPPTGMFANIHKALDNFNQETLDSCTKETEFKAILFALCYYHAVLCERKKFGAQGWNRSYPFNFGDLTISVSVLLNYLENSTKVPWEDLRYLFGEIMYGGHITDDWDRRLCRTYLLEYLQPELVEGELFLAPGFLVPPNTDYVGYHQYLDDFLPAESPMLYGLHANAEIGFLTIIGETLFRTVFEMQPRDTGESAGVGLSREEKVKSIIDDLLDRLPPEFHIQELMARVEDRTPFVIVAFQECERMNILCDEMRRSLQELDLGLKGELTINADMEDLQGYLFMDMVPPTWTKRAYPSSLGLTGWFSDMLNRVEALAGWTSDFTLPSSVWLGGFFNPQSFLTAIMQQTARRNEWPLDKMCLHCDVTRKQKEEFTAPPREGAYVNSLFMEGARWDTAANSIGDAKMKELFPLMPVVYIKAITQDKQDLKSVYECPIYKTRDRGPTYVWTFNLKSKDKPTKWILAGVAILLQI